MTLNLSEPVAMVASMKTELAEHRIVALLPKSLLAKVKRAAKRNGRSLSGEVRYALTNAYGKDS